MTNIQQNHVHPRRVLIEIDYKEPHQQVVKHVYFTKLLTHIEEVPSCEEVIEWYSGRKFTPTIVRVEYKYVY